MGRDRETAGNDTVPAGGVRAAVPAGVTPAVHAADGASPPGLSQRPAHRPVVLDLDGSVGSLQGEVRLPLSDWQETMRFACTHAQMGRFREELARSLPPTHGTVLMGSGDFHHLSWPLIQRHPLPPGGKMRVLVFDNHPDNMRFPFGVHCGSWVRRVAALPQVSRVDVVGITSSDIGWGHCWENHLAPLRSGKLIYWSVGVDTGWGRWLGLGRAFRNFDDTEALTQALCETLQAAPQPTYLSIDKDVFSTEVVQTNWDQGRLTEGQLMRAVTALQGQIVGSDITGDVSAYRYRTAWKRWLSHVDAQDTEIAPDVLRRWQAAQHALNGRVVERIAAALLVA